MDVGEYEKRLTWGNRMVPSDEERLIIRVLGLIVTIWWAPDRKR